MKGLSDQTISGTDLFWKRCLLVLLVFQFLWLGVSHGLMEESWSTLWDRVVRCSILLVWMRVGLSKAASGRPWFTGIGHPLGVLMLLMGAWKACGALWSISPLVVLDEVENHFWLTSTVMVLLDAVRLKEVREGLKSSWPLVLLLGLAYGLYQWGWVFPQLRQEVKELGEWGNPVLYQRWLIRVNSNEVFGLRFYPNLFGLLCGMGLLSMLLVRRGSAGSMAMALACLAGVALSGSKSAMIFSTGLLLLAFVSRDGVRFLGPKAGKISLALLPIIGGVMGWWLWPFLEASVKIRLEYWASTWNMFLQHPWGVGAGVFNQWYNSLMGPDGTEVALAHNDHLQVLAELGWVGGLLHAAFWGWLVWFLYRSQSISRTELAGGRVSGEKAVGELAEKAMPDIAKKALRDSIAERTVIDLAEKPVSDIASIALGFALLMGYLVIFCLVLGVGPMDLPVGGPLFLLVCALLGYVWIKKVKWEFDHTGVLALLMLFLVVASVDFPLEDGALVAMVFFLVFPWMDLVSSPSSRFCQTLGTGLALLLISLGLGWTWLHQDRVLWRQSVEVMSQEELVSMELGSIGGLNALHHWQVLYQRLSRESEPDLELEGMKRRSLEFLTDSMPGRANFWEKLGLSCDDQEDRLRAWLKAYSLAPQQPRHAYHLGELFLGMNDRAMARTWFAKALERHRYAKSKLETIPDMELHLLQADQVSKAEAVLIP